MNTMYKLTKQATLADIATVVERHLMLNEKMVAQLLPLEDGKFIIQGRAQSGKLKQFVGMDRAITVTLTPYENDNFYVEIGEGKWVDKAVMATVSLFILWPLAVTSGVGFYKQKKLPKNICAAIEAYLR